MPNYWAQKLLWSITLAWLAMALHVAAHPSDVSQLRVKLAHQQVELRFTFNVLTITRLVLIDTDHDQRITPEEFAKAAPLMADYLKKKVLISVNETETDLGSFSGYDCVWPHSSTGAVTDRDASQRFVDFTFVKPWTDGVQDVWLGFQIFAETGDQHTIQAVYHQEGQPDSPVEFSQREPEYLYDTGWTEEDFKAPPPAKPRPWILSVSIAAVALLLIMLWKRRRGSGRISDAESPA